MRNGFSGFVTMVQISCFFLILFIWFGSYSEVKAIEFDYNSLTLTSLKLLGDAHLRNTTICLSRDISVPNSGAGRALYSNPVRFLDAETRTPASFSTFFSFSVTNFNPSSIGGGLAFLIAPDDHGMGDSGGFLGLINGTAFPSTVIAVEFDTLMDVEFNDINGNHVGLDLSSMISTEVADLDAIEVDLKSGNLVNAWIDYSGKNRIFNITVSYSNLKPVNPLLSLDLDLTQFLNEFMFVGFSGSTQGSTESHSIEWWSFSSSSVITVSSSQPPPPPPPVFSSSSTTTTGFSNSSNPPISAPSGSVSIPQNSPEARSSTCHNRICKQDPAAVAGVVTAGAFFLALFTALLIWVWFKKFKPLKNSESLASEIIKTPKEFTYRELKSATKNFDSSRIIGHGAFGTVYKGIIPDTGAIVAVKRCSHSGQGKKEFLSELSIIGALRHRNLVRLHGWCQERGEILLVYDFMPNSSLDKALFQIQPGSAQNLLPWHHRRRILMGVASALAYLHQECENRVIHRDIKASNIMLDGEFNAKLGDFGLAKQIEHDRSPDATITAGTMGYLAPEYLLSGRATEKTDVFSFGAVVLEVACGRRPIEKDGIDNSNNNNNNGSCRNRNLVEWVWNLHTQGRIVEAADVRLGGEFDEGEMDRILLVGLICSHPDPSYRPTMRNVLQILNGEAPLPCVPKSKPSMSFSTHSLLLSLQDSVSDYNGGITISSSSTSSSNPNCGRG